MEEIRAYLTQTDPDYQAGITLLAGQSKNRNLLNNLRNKENEQNTAKLRFELARFLNEPELAALPTVAQQLHEELGPPAATSDETAPAGTLLPAAETPSVTEGRADLPAEVTAEVDGIVELQAKLHNEMVQISNTLADLPSDEARTSAVERQDQLEKQYNALAEKKTLILSTGTLPVAPAEGEAAPLDREELKKKQLSLRSTISKAKGSLAKAKTPETVSHYEQKLAQAQAELNTVTLQLTATAVPKDV